MMKKLFGIVLLGLLLSNCTISDTQMKSTSTNRQDITNYSLEKILKIAKKESRWRNDTPQDELKYHKNHCITKDYKKVLRQSGCGFDIDAKTFLDIKMVSEVIANRYEKQPKLFWNKLVPLRKEITENYLKK